MQDFSFFFDTANCIRHCFEKTVFLNTSDVVEIAKCFSYLDSVFTSVNYKRCLLTSANGNIQVNQRLLFLHKILSILLKVRILPYKVVIQTWERSLTFTTALDQLVSENNIVLEIVWIVVFVLRKVVFWAGWNFLFNSLQWSKGIFGFLCWCIQVELL